MSIDDALERRIARLRQELHEEVQLELTREGLEELAHARFMDPHEGRRAAFGAVIWCTALSPARAGVPPLPSTGGFIARQANLPVLRTFADGRTSFVVRGPGVIPAVAIDPAWTGSESNLADYSNTAGVTVVQRLASGRVRLFQNQRVYTEEGGNWLARPTAAAYKEKLGLVLDVAHQEVAGAILDMCVHTLSPAGHGATLIWFPVEARTAADHLDFSLAIDPPALSTTDARHRQPIAHALGQMDRAVVLRADGSLRTMNVTLSCAEEASTRNFEGGTRHNSAGRYSASQEAAIVFVVSSDGPVTVFHRGEVVAAVR